MEWHPTFVSICMVYRLYFNLLTKLVFCRVYVEGGVCVDEIPKLLRKKKQRV